MTPELLKELLLGELLPKMFQELAGFDMAGQWTEPGGGLPLVTRGGRNILRLIMKAEGRKAARWAPG